MARDREGIVQVFFDPDRATRVVLASELRNEFSFRLAATVSVRVTRKTSRGYGDHEIEVLASSHYHQPRSRLTAA